MAYNLFISHSWSYSHEYERLVGLLDDSGIEYKNYSIPFHDPIHNARNERKLKEAIRNKMSYASCVLILAGVYSTYSYWINAEIELANHGFYKPKKIIAIEPFGSERTSSVVKDAADIIVKWNKNSITNAIMDLCNECY